MTALLTRRPVPAPSRWNAAAVLVIFRVGGRRVVRVVPAAPQQESRS